MVQPNPLQSHPWERQNDESLLWFQRFEFYLALPIGDRSLKNAYIGYEREVVNLPEDKIPKVVPSNWKDAYSKYRWKQRAKVYQDFIKDSREARNQEFYDITRATLQKQVDLLISRTEAMLNYPLTEVKQVSEDGKEVHITKPYKWQASDIPGHLRAIRDMSKFITDNGMGATRSGPAQASSHASVHVGKDGVAISSRSKKAERTKQFEEMSDTELMDFVLGHIGIQEDD